MSDAMTRTFGVALLALRPGPPYDGWRPVGRQPIGRLDVERLRQGYPLPELNWRDFPEPLVVHGAAILDPAGKTAHEFPFRRAQAAGPHDLLRWTYP